MGFRVGSDGVRMEFERRSNDIHGKSTGKPGGATWGSHWHSCRLASGELMDYPRNLLSRRELHKDYSVPVRGLLLSDGTSVKLMWGDTNEQRHDD